MTLPRDLAALLAADPSLQERVRNLAAGPPTGQFCTTPEALAAVVAPLFLGRETEALVVVALDSRNRVICAEVLTSGSAQFTIVDPAQVYRWALTRQRPARSVAIAHNHPSGDPTPSSQDHEVTRRVGAAGKVLGVPLIDHLIYASPKSWYSFAATGTL